MSIIPDGVVVPELCRRLTDKIEEVGKLRQEVRAGHSIVHVSPHVFFSLRVFLLLVL